MDHSSNMEIGFMDILKSILDDLDPSSGIGVDIPYV